MYFKRGLLTAAFVLCVSTAFAACGKGDDGNDGGKEALVTETVKEEVSVEKTFSIKGGQEWIYAPKAGEISVSSPFTAELVVNGEVQARSGVIWSIESSGKGVSIDAEGIVTITDEFIYGDINGTDVTIKATVDGLTATQNLHVRERQRVGSFQLKLPLMTYLGVRVDIEFANVTDQYGEPMELAVSDVDWDLSHAGMAVNGNQIWTSVTISGDEIFAGVRGTVDGVKAEGRFIIAKRVKGSEYVVTPEKEQELKDARIVFASDIDFSVARELDKNLYTYINRDLASYKEETYTADVSGLLKLFEKQLYQVTVLFEDGSVVKEDKEAVDGKVSVSVNYKAEDGSLKHCTAMEISPVFKFALGRADIGESKEFAKVGIGDRYSEDVLYGFYGTAEEIAGGVSLKTDDTAFVAALPDGFYDIKITKPQSGTGRSTVRVNEASLGTNVGNPGKGDRAGSVPYIYLMEDVKVKGGTARLSLGEKDFTLALVEIRKAPEIVKRRTHVYIGGDSTVSNYYPIENAEPDYGRFQTGWGQVIGQYFSENNTVTNLAGGGTYAKSWYEIAFNGVLQNAEPGDYFIIHAGINDRTYSNREEMVQYLTKMIEECEAKGITVILCTAMQTPKFWKDANGQEVPEYGVPEGGGLAAFMDSIRTLAKEKNVFLVDVGKLTGELYGKLGRSYVVSHYHLYNSGKKLEEDTLHLSYHGALKIAELICTDLQRQMEEGAKDHLGHTLDGLSFNEMTTYELEYTDVNGNVVKEEVNAVKAVYEKYGEENK